MSIFNENGEIIKIQPNNIVDRNDFYNMKKCKMVIIGEIHQRSMIDYYDRLLSNKKPEYFICEFADQDKCHNKETLKSRMDNATNGSSKGNGADYQYNYWCYELAYKHDCKLIGCNKIHYGKVTTMDEEDKIREAYMLRVLREYEDKNSVVQLGDHHLRSIPISKEFLDYTGDKVDDRGIVTDLTVSNASPIWNHFINKPNVCISRVKEEYNNELNFIKSKNK